MSDDTKYHTDYLQKVFRNLNKNLEEVKALILKSGIEYDTIVVSGVSGMMFGSPLSILLGKDIAVVRKDGSAHSMFKIESAGKVGRWIFVDDLVASGSTFRKVMFELKKDRRHRETHKFVGVLCYDPHECNSSSRFYTAKQFVGDFGRSDDDWLPRAPVNPEPETPPKIVRLEQIVEMKKELVDKNILSLPVMPMLPVKDPEGIVIKETDPFENAKFKFDYMKPMTFGTKYILPGAYC